MAALGRLLGYGGLLPFLATSALLWWTSELVHLQIGLIYGAVILSFLGGIRWGLALAAPEPRAGELAWSVVPALVGWGALLLQPLATPLVLAVGFFVAWLWEQRTGQSLALPEWYPPLRHVLTLVVIVCLLADAWWVAQVAELPGR